MLEDIVTFLESKLRKHSPSLIILRQYNKTKLTIPHIK
jgi:hypothetical protein